ncbi:hypothetical protein KF840_01930 [bacterium]|nr:hypothetical protein [bacterium]
MAGRSTARMTDPAIVLQSGIIGMITAAVVIAGRDACARAVWARCRLAPRWLPVLAGAVTGSGLAMLIAAAWVVHGVIAPPR